jgi:hypothetical protein
MISNGNSFGESASAVGSDDPALFAPRSILRRLLTADQSEKP